MKTKLNPYLVVTLSLFLSAAFYPANGLSEDDRESRTRGVSQSQTQKPQEGLFSRLWRAIWPTSQPEQPSQATRAQTSSNPPAPPPSSGPSAEQPSLGRSQALHGDTQSSQARRPNGMRVIHGNQFGFTGDVPPFGAVPYSSALHTSPVFPQYRNPSDMVRAMATQEFGLGLTTPNIPQGAPQSVPNLESALQQLQLKKVLEKEERKKQQELELREKQLREREEELNRQKQELEESKKRDEEERIRKESEVLRLQQEEVNRREQEVTQRERDLEEKKRRDAEDLLSREREEVERKRREVEEKEKRLREDREKLLMQGALQGGEPSQTLPLMNGHASALAGPRPLDTGESRKELDKKVPNGTSDLAPDTDSGTDRKKFIGTIAKLAQVKIIPQGGQVSTVPNFISVYTYPDKQHATSDSDVKTLLGKTAPASFEKLETNLRSFKAYFTHHKRFSANLSIDMLVNGLVEFARTLPLDCIRIASKATDFKCWVLLIDNDTGEYIVIKIPGDN